MESLGRRDQLGFKKKVTSYGEINISHQSFFLSDQAQEKNELANPEALGTTAMFPRKQPSSRTQYRPLFLMFRHSTKSYHWMTPKWITLLWTYIDGHSGPWGLTAGYRRFWLIVWSYKPTTVDIECVPLTQAHTPVPLEISSFSTCYQTCPSCFLPIRSQGREKGVIYMPACVHRLHQRFWEDLRLSPTQQEFKQKTLSFQSTGLLSQNSQWWWFLKIKDSRTLVARA